MLKVEKNWPVINCGDGGHIYATTSTSIYLSSLKKRIGVGRSSSKRGWGGSDQITSRISLKKKKPSKREEERKNVCLLYERTNESSKWRRRNTKAMNMTLGQLDWLRQASSKRWLEKKPVLCDNLDLGALLRASELLTPSCFSACKVLVFSVFNSFSSCLAKVLGSESGAFLLQLLYLFWAFVFVPQPLHRPFFLLQPL